MGGGWATRRCCFGRNAARDAGCVRVLRKEGKTARCFQARAVFQMLSGLGSARRCGGVAGPAAMIDTAKSARERRPGPGPNHEGSACINLGGSRSQDLSWCDWVRNFGTLRIFPERLQIFAEYRPIIRKLSEKDSKINKKDSKIIPFPNP